MFHFSPRNALLPSTALAILLGLTACGGGGGSDDTTASASASASAAAAAAAAGTASGAAAGAAAGTITTTTPPPALPTKALGLTDQRASPVATPNVVRLVGFDIATPNTLTTNVAIATAAGVGAAAFAANEWIFGMDYRPADGLLWGLTNRGRLYTIDPTTGVATLMRKFWPTKVTTRIRSACGLKSTLTLVLASSPVKPGAAGSATKAILNVATPVPGSIVYKRPRFVRPQSRPSTGR